MVLNLEIANEQLKKGRICTFDLSDLERSLPGFVTEDVKEQAYRNEIALRMRQAKMGVVNSKNKEYSVEIECLGDIEDLLTRAHKAGFDIDTLEYKMYLSELIESQSGNFNANRALYLYTTESIFPIVNQYVPVIKNNLENLAPAYVREKLKECRRVAKDLRKLVKVGYNHVSNLKKNLEDVLLCKEFGVDESARVKEIKEIAYNRGVAYLIAVAHSRYKRTNPEKYDRLLKVAKINANALGMPYNLL